MVDPPLQQEKILEIAIHYLKSLKKDQEGRITLVKLPPDLLPSETTSALIRNFLFNIAQTASLEELFQKKEEVIGLLEQAGQKPLPTTKIVAPRGEVIVRPEEDQRGEKRIKITGLEDVQEMVANLVQQVENLRKAPPEETKKRKKERIVYEEEPLTATEEEIQETIQAIETSLNRELEKARSEHPALEKRLKEPQDVSRLAHQAAQAVKESLTTLTDKNQAVNAIQRVIQKETDLSLDDTYSLAARVIRPDIKQKAHRYQAGQWVGLNRRHQHFTETVQSALRQTGLSHRQIDQTINLVDSAIDPLLETKNLIQKTPNEALQAIEATLRPALSGGLSSRNAELASKTLASLEVAQALQELAKVSFRWDTLPEETKKRAFQKTVPLEGEKTVLEIKRYIIQYSLGGEASTKREEAKTEKVAAETTRALAEKKAEIMARARQRGLRARVPPEQVLSEILPQVLKETLAEVLNPEEYGSEFVQQVEEGLQKEFPPFLLASIQEIIETPPVQLAPAEKEKAAATVKKFIAEELLLGKIAPKEEASIEEIARTTVKEMEKGIQASPFPIERPEQIREIILKSLSRALEQYEEKYPLLVQKIDKGVNAARAAEKLPFFLLKNIQETIETLPPKLLPWEEKAITELEEKGILSPESAAAYRKRIAQRREEIEAFLSPITPPGVVSRTSEKALASYLLSEKRTKEEKEKFSERIRFLIDQAKELIPKNKIARNLLNRLFRLITGEKSPLKTAKTLVESGPGKLNFPARFRQEIFKRFVNTFFQKNKWLKFDTYTGRLYSRFGRQALQRGLSRFFSPLRTRFTQGLGRLTKIANQILPKIGKLLNRVLPLLKQLAMPIFKALAGLLSQLATFLVGLAAQAAAWLAGAVGAIVSAVGVPVIIVVIIIAVIVVIIIAVLGVGIPSTFVDYSDYPRAEYGSCNLVDPLISSQLLVGTFQQSGGAFKVPPGVIAGVANIEGGHLWSYTDIEILTYSEEGGQDPYKTCQPNTCGARGPMQFLTGERSPDPDECPQTCLKVDKDTGECVAGLDVWSNYKEAVNEATGEGRDSHVCNIKDSIFAGAKMLKEKSQTAPENDCEWNQEQVYNAARGFYGKCEYTIEWGGEIITGDYCKQVWQYYINSSTEPVIYP